MAELLHPEDLPRWVPGKIALASDQLGWCDVLVRSYEYAPSEVFVPAMRDFLLIAYREGPTSMDRKVNGRWTREFLVPGNVSLLNRAEESHWHWCSDIGVIHLYIAQDALAAVSSEVFDRDIADVRLRDVLKTDDPALFGSIMALAEEAKSDRLGGHLFVDAVTKQLCIHILRKYAVVEFRENRLPTGLCPLQARLVAEYIELNIDKPLSLRELAVVARMSASHFLRQFKRRFETTPHCYVVERRLACAKNLLSRTAISLKDIASHAGFSDQSHMTRMFQRHLGTTPGAYRTAIRA